MKMIRTFLASLSLMASAAMAQPVVDYDEIEEIVLFPDSSAEATFLMPRRSIQKDELLVVFNGTDNLSIDIKNHYVMQRQIPPENVLEVSIPVVGTTNGEVSQAAMAPAMAAIAAKLANRDDIQAIALAWVRPWRVNTFEGLASDTNSRSITNYIAQGPISTNTYIGSDSSRPWTDHGFRPTMAIAAMALPDAVSLIDRAVSSDGTFPGGTGYFLNTSDLARSAPRNANFQDTIALFDPLLLNLSYSDLSAGVEIGNDTILNLDDLIATGDFLSNAPDVLFHFTGLATVPGIASNTFVPGAIADHLTSGAGAITYRGNNFFGCGPDTPSQDCPPPTPGYAQTQMSALNWLENGAAATYGNVFEPGASQPRFPDTRYLVPNYFGGGTAIESLWKSVSDTRYGLFIGEPLARPFSWRVPAAGGAPSIDTTSPIPGKVYSVWSASDVGGPFTLVEPNIVVNGPNITNVAMPSSGNVALLHEQDDRFYLNKWNSAGGPGIACASQTSDGLVWCQFNRLYYQPVNGVKQLISDSASNGVASVYNDTVYWIESDGVGGNALYSMTLPGGTPTLLTATDWPGIALVATAEQVIWSYFSPAPNMRRINAYRHDTGETTQITTPQVLLNNFPEFDAEGNDIVFIGRRTTDNQVDVYRHSPGSPLKQITDDVVVETHPGISGSQSVWISDGDIYTQTPGLAPELFDDPWDLNGAVDSLTLDAGMVSATQLSDGSRQLWVTDIAAQQSMLFPKVFGRSVQRQNVRYSSGAVLTKVQVNSDVSVVSREAVTAIHDGFDDRSVSAGTIAQFYLRPDIEFFEDGTFSYQFAMADGSSIASAGISVDVFPLGDIDEDGEVNFSDFALFGPAFLSSVGDADYNARLDFDNSGAINFADYAVLISNFLNIKKLDVAMVSWDSSAVAPGTPLQLVGTIVANQGTQIRKSIALTVQ